MAKAPGDSRIPTGVRAPLPGAVRRTLSGFPAPSRLLPSRLRLPGLKSKSQDSNKTKMLTSQKNVDNKTQDTNLTFELDSRITEDNKDSTFSLCNKISEAEKTFEIIRDSKDITFDLEKDNSKIFSGDKENKKEKEEKMKESHLDENLALSKMSLHLGERVSAVLSDSRTAGVSTVTGILKYVGHVQTDGDLWCGLETDVPSADYHNGSVNSVKYFSCKSNHGILVPIKQIKLQPLSNYSSELNIGLKSKQHNSPFSSTFTSNDQLRLNVIDITHQLVDDIPKDNLNDSGPYSLLVGLDHPRVLPNQDEIRTNIIHEKLKNRNLLPSFSTPNSTNTLNSTPKYLNPLINSIHDESQRLSDINVRLIDAESMIDLRSINFEGSENDSIQDSQLSDSTMPLIGKESMLEYHSIDFDSLPMETVNTKEEKATKHRGSLVLSKPTLSDISTSEFASPQLDSNCLGASTPYTGTNNTSQKKKKNNKTNDSNVFSGQSKQKHFILGPPTRKQNLLDSRHVMEKQIDEDHSKNINVFKVADSYIKLPAMITQDLPSPTVSEKSLPQISKQNSFDESLGILTPDLMDSISFLDNVRSPSTDDLNELLDSTKTTEKTVSSNSQTPSTENVKSLTPDALKCILSSQINNENDAKLIEPCEKLENTECASSENILEKTIINSPSKNVNPILIDFIDDDTNYQNENEDYDVFVQRPFKQSTAESLDKMEMCSTTITQSIEDELLPSVHSSILDPLSSVVDTTVNLDLPLDSRRYDGIHQPTVVRMDQTPSPEELPLDPIDMRTDLSMISSNQFCSSTIQEQSQADSENKTDTTKSVTSKVSNSFITSITSITSLDGYQGDGEMSRPVSRGADHSPTIGHRGVHNLQNHWQNIPINRRPDPMTDSDFFTESDADAHDDQVHRGDRRAQVIDGALYGGGKGSNPPIMVNQNGNSNNEDSCMESSGVFTDMETHRCSPLLLNVIDDLSPEGSTPSTRSELSQKNNSGLFYDGFNGSFNETVVAVSLHSPNQNGDTNGNKDASPNHLKQNNPKLERNVKKHQESSTSSAPTDKMNKEEKNMALKKHKMPRRDVASKVKTMLTKPNEDDNHDKRPSPKTAKKGRWDAVMNKISAGKSDAKPKSYLKDVKSKVTSRTDITRKSLEEASNASGTTSPKARTLTSKLKSRRVRSRLPEATPAAGGSARSSPHSSQSDVSLAGAPPPKHPPPKHPPNRNSKKRDVRMSCPTVGPTAPPPPAPHHQPAPSPPIRTQPSPVVAKQTNGTIVKKGAPASPLGARVPAPVSRKPAPRRAATTLSARQPPPTHRDHPRPASPKPPPLAVAPPTVALAPVVQPPPTRGVEALAVLVHYLVYQLDALNAPRWRAQVAQTKAQLGDVTTQLEKAITAQNTDHIVVGQCLNKIAELESELQTKEAHYNATITLVTDEAEKKYRTALEENEAISGDLKNLKVSLGQLRKDLSACRAALAESNKKSEQREAHRVALDRELQKAKEQMRKFKDVHRNGKELTLAAEVSSLKSVLELKMSELAEIRKRGGHLEQAAAALPEALHQAAYQKNISEYLRGQVQYKIDQEAKILQQYKQLQEAHTQLLAQKERLALHNEQLQYKLKHNTEVANLLAQSEHERLNHTFPETFIRGSLRTTASFNEKYLRSTSCQERGSSVDVNSPRRSARSDSSDNSAILEKNRCVDYFIDSPPNSPKIKGVVEKSESVSWILEIEEAPEETVSRIVKRANSFRSSVSPHHPVRETLKRQLPPAKGSSVPTSNSLCQSNSASSLESTGRSVAHCKLFRSNSIEHKDHGKPSCSSTPVKGRRSSERTHLSHSLPATRPRASSLSHEIKSTSPTRRSSSLHKEVKVCPDKKMSLRDYDHESQVTNSDLALLQECEPVLKESAGEALISGTNSEDDSSLDDRSHSPSDSESLSESDKYPEMNGAGERPVDPVLRKMAENMSQSLSTTPMEVSWSEDGECFISESDI